ncbi:MAG: peptidoglycan DD-metalloendopeptidase family protein [Solobacterium sp.]|nr:peptidoglycan DD-metalloendopeptidase family protein [Solobacterium sp.]
MKKILAVLISLIAAVVVVVFLPHVMTEVNGFAYEETEKEAGKIGQKIIRVEAYPQEVYRVYDAGSLVGVLSDHDSLDSFLKEVYKRDYAAEFPRSSVSLGKDVFVSREMSYYTYENKDPEILSYLDEHKLFTVRTTAVEFSDENGVYDEIYVSSENLYEEAMNEYLTYFISARELQLLNSGQKTPELRTYESRAVGISIMQTITIKEAYASPDEIMRTKEEILDYIEYGRNPQKYYYIVQKYDTVAGVGAKNNGLSAVQVMNINRDQISSTDQVLSEGMRLCVSYFNPIIDVVVMKESMRKETIYPETVYAEDENIRKGETELIQAGVNGSKNALYSERWINGVLLSGTLISSVDTLQPIDEVIGVGTMEIPGVGTGVYRWPVDNPHISCPWYCYWGHEAIDVQNFYDRYGPIYAADRGVVVENAYHYISGNYLIIDHNNGQRTYYGHMNVPSPLPVGTIVDKGDYIGQLGMTGYATGPHTHFYIEENGIKLDPCKGFLDCSEAP